MTFSEMKSIQVFGNTYRTSDYGIFKRLDGNRAVLSRRVSRISKSISENGYIYNPIVVNENFEIIDGQGRFEALRMNGLPIDFVVAEGARLTDCVALNAYTSAWTLTDYVDSYCELGNENYLRFRALMREFPSLNIRTIVQFTTGLSNIPQNKIKEGDLVVLADMMEEIRENLSFISICMPSLSRVKGSRDSYCYAVGFAKVSGANTERLINCLTRAELSPAPNVKTACDNVSDLYNWHLSDANKRIYLWPLYQQSMCEKLGWYAARYGKAGSEVLGDG